MKVIMVMDEKEAAEMGAVKEGAGFGIAETDAVRACTINPACALGVQDQVGSISTGKIADFIVCRSDYTGRRVFMGGKEI